MFNSRWLSFVRRSVPRPNATVFFRTHFWDESVARAYIRLKDTTRLDVVVCADETRGALSLPKGIARSSHSLARFESMGLPARPGRKPLWHNGDYPLYSNAEDCDSEYIVMVEYDMHIGTELDPIIGSICRRGLDFTATKLSSRTPQWHWTNHTRTALMTEIEGGASPHSEVPPIIGCLFPFVTISRKAARRLFERRLQLANALAEAGTLWPFCEAFAPTEVAAAGMAFAGVGEFVDESRVKTRFPIHSSKVPELRGKFAHPILEGSAYLQKVLTGHDVRRRADYERQRTVIDPLLALEAPELVQQVLSRLSP